MNLILQTLRVSPGVPEGASDANVLPAAGPGSTEGRGASGAGSRESSRQDVPGQDPGARVRLPRAAPKCPSHAEGVSCEAPTIES